MAFATINQPAAATKAHAGNGLIAGLQMRFAKYRAYRRCIEELESLSNRELNDLGIARSMIQVIARQEVYGA